MLFGCEVSGTISDENTPLEDVAVILSDNASLSITTYTDSNGNYEFNGLIAGSYTLTPSSEENSFYPKSIDLTVDSKSLSGINFYTDQTGADLRQRRYNEVSYVTTHNSMSNAEDRWLFPNQQYNIEKQLKDGARSLMLDLWPKDGKVYLCHGGIFLGGSDLLENQLNIIKNFMDTYHREIITIIFESYVDAQSVKDVFEACDLTSYLHTQPVDQPWPVLQDMIDQNKRLVVFTDENDALPDMQWYHYCWNYCWETHYSAQAPEDFSCSPNRGDAGNNLFIFNHFLTNDIGGSINLAKQVNYNPFFIDRVLDCQTESGQLPNFITVDFYNIGNVFDVTDTLNNP